MAGSWQGDHYGLVPKSALNEDGRSAALDYLNGLIRRYTNPSLLAAAKAVRAELLAEQARGATR